MISDTGRLEAYSTEQMESKEHILAAIRKQSVPLRDLPSLDREWITYPDRFVQFQAAVASVGGSCVEVESVAHADLLLRNLPAYQAAREVVSLVPGIGEANVGLNA